MAASLGHGSAEASNAAMEAREEAERSASKREAGSRAAVRAHGELHEGVAGVRRCYRVRKELAAGVRVMQVAGARGRCAGKLR